MSATETLRAMLDERGVPWKDYGYENHTWWGEWHAENRPSVNGLFMKVEGVVTPAQAIAATLGATDARPTQEESSGTCHEIEDEDTGFIVCSECGAIHDESYTAYYCWCCGRRVEQ